jgi:hypothetical protein
MTGAKIMLAQVPGVNNDPHYEQSATTTGFNCNRSISQLHKTTPGTSRATCGVKPTSELKTGSCRHYSPPVHTIRIIWATVTIRHIVERAPIGGDINWAMQHECMDGRASTWPTTPYIGPLKVSPAAKALQLGKSPPYKTICSRLILSGRGSLGDQSIGGYRSRHVLEHSLRSPIRQGRPLSLGVDVLRAVSQFAPFILEFRVVAFSLLA